MNNISQIVQAAHGQWPFILDGLGIAHHKQHSACPACGGKDRFRFDDIDGRGTWICNQCGAGDGLELVKRVFQTDNQQAAQRVADVLNMEFLQSIKKEPKILFTSPHKADDITNKVSELLTKTKRGGSSYLTAKGLAGHQYPILPDGRMVLPLLDGNHHIRGAQLIAPDGTKRLLAGTQKKGAFIPTSEPQGEVRTIILTEGFATALSVFLMCSDAFVVAAIDAGNLPHVARELRQQYPDASLIIAGDNDIGNDKNTGKDAAEKAALVGQGLVTLPPTTGKADWDDYRQRVGEMAAHRAFVDGLYSPNPVLNMDNAPPLPERENLHQNGKASIKTASDDPQPKQKPLNDKMRPYADIRHGGLYWIEPKADKDTGELIERESWLCGALEVVGIGEDDSERYLILSWQPEGTQQPKTQAIPMRDIGEREGWATLRAGGLSITAKNGLRAILADHLQRSGSRSLWAIANATGWQYGAYIMPDGSVIGTPTKPVLFNGRSAAARGYTVKGTAESWQQNVASLARGNPSMMLGIACAFAAPLIGIIDADGFGVHLFGGSSAGKTTTGNMATSIYGEPEALKLTWYSTALGLINEAAAHNDGFMPLDEIGQGSNKKAVAEAAYALFNGVGKLQGAKEGGNRAVKRWRAMAFSTGEIDLESYIKADGAKVNAGQLIRLLNIPITKATHYHGYPDGKAHANALREATNHHYGAVGRAWIGYLADQKQNAIEAVKVADSRWLGLLPDEASEQVRRVASRFAVLEAALLLSGHLTGWDVQECRDALQHSFNAWVNEFGMANRESKAWVEQAEAFLQRYGYSRYLPYPNSDPRDLPIKDLAGYRVKNVVDDEIIFHTWPNVFKEEIATGANYVAFAQVLAEAGMLNKPKKGVSKKSIVIDGRQPHFVILRYSPDEEDS